MNLDRRAHSLQNALEEARTILDQTDRARRYESFYIFQTNFNIAIVDLVI